MDQRERVCVCARACMPVFVRTSTRLKPSGDVAYSLNFEDLDQF